jgi:hypothetical protein
MKEALSKAGHRQLAGFYTEFFPGNDPNDAWPTPDPGIIFILVSRSGPLKMEPAVGIEPTTDGLQNRCSAVRAVQVKLRPDFKNIQSRSARPNKLGMSGWAAWWSNRKFGRPLSRPTRDNRKIASHKVAGNGIKIIFVPQGTMEIHSSYIINGSRALVFRRPCGTLGSFGPRPATPWQATFLGSLRDKGQRHSTIQQTMLSVECFGPYAATVLLESL